MARTNIAQENAEIVERGSYTNATGAQVEFSASLARCLKQTRLYRPADAAALLTGPRTSPTAAAATKLRVEVTTEKSGAAGRRVAGDGRGDPLVLNFASARNPGGGYVRGAKAQEEDLARASALYHSQLTQPTYYDCNRRQSSLLYTDHLIYSPRVPFFRDESGRFLDEPVEISVVTAPAPNAGEVRRRRGADVRLIEATLRHRARLVLAVARAHGHRELVLGAWGCGVFRNDPDVVARAFADPLASDEFAEDFDWVVFPIYEREASRPRLAAFQARFPSA